ncbi:hypothetical protein Tco_0633553 [Tanacetum coccineum]
MYLRELRDSSLCAFVNLHKEKTKKLHDSKITEPNLKCWVIFKSFASTSRLRISSESSSPDGPDFTITEVYPYGTAKLSHADGSNFKVNCHRLKHYYGGDTPPLLSRTSRLFPRTTKSWIESSWRPHGMDKSKITRKQSKTSKHGHENQKSTKSKLKAEAKPKPRNVKAQLVLPEILKKFNYTDVKSASTLVDLKKPLVKDGDADDVDVYLYRSMIESLMYLITSRPDIIYLKGKPTLGLWYSRDSPFELVAYTDSDYAGATQDRKSTTRDLLTKGFDAGREKISTARQKIVGDEAIHKELGDRMERAATTTSSLKAEQDSEKPAESDRFHEIIDFLNAKANTVNSERQLQALVDKKRVIIMESSIRSDLHLAGAGGIDCLPTTTIFEELTHIGAKSTPWNEFSSTMASTIIYFATNQKFNLSKYIYDVMVKHLEGGVKYLRYPCFVQVFLNNQLGDMSHYKKIYGNPSHTKKIFSNMKREGKDFYGRVTPLFATMMVQATQDKGVDSGIPTDSQLTPITTQPSSSRP